MNQPFPGEWWLRESCKILGISEEETEGAVERGRVEMEKFKVRIDPLSFTKGTLPPLPTFMTTIEEGMMKGWEKFPIDPPPHVSKEDGDE